MVEKVKQNGDIYKFIGTNILRLIKHWYMPGFDPATLRFSVNKLTTSLPEITEKPYYYIFQQVLL